MWCSGALSVFRLTDSLANERKVTILITKTLDVIFFPISWGHVWVSYVYCFASILNSTMSSIAPDDIRPWMNQTGWIPPISQFIQVEFLLLKWLHVEICFVFNFNFRSLNFTSSIFPIQPNFSQNQPAAITLNTSSPRTLLPSITTLYYIDYSN